MQAFCALLVGVMVTASVYLILDRNLIRFIFGLILASNAINLLIFTVGGLDSGRPPIIPSHTTVIQEPFANALPQALILTAIVIGFALLSFIFVLFYRAYQDLGTVETESMRIAEADFDHQPPQVEQKNGGTA
jgi:multicomponent Na+:H+ antiporter subunit C